MTGLQSRVVRLERSRPDLYDPFAHLSDSALQSLCDLLNATRAGELERAAKIHDAQTAATLAGWRRALEAMADA